MATQTTDGMTWVSAMVFVSADGSTWTEVTGHGASINVGGGERRSSDQNTMADDTPIVKPGNRGAVNVTVRYVYTSEDADPFEVLRTIHDDDGVIYLQYTPDDTYWFKSGAGVLVRPGYPGGDAGSGDLIMSEFVVNCAALTKATASD